MSTLTMIISLFGGLGLFLYGMKIMGDGLENASGDKLKAFFEKITSNPLKGVATGAIVTALIQSSSATTVMVVGFVNARIMDLYQAAAVIMGANIGTTITAQLISLKISHFIPIFLGVGALMTLFSKKEGVKQIGGIILGFGILFAGMDMMKDAMKPLGESTIFVDFISTLSGNWVLGILTGLIMTAVVQSSSATTGILIALTSTGVITLQVAVPILFGCNIGTCVTALISSIGTSKTAKKAALIHLIFNLVGTLIFIPLMPMLIKIVMYMTPEGANIVKRQIANAHTVFNIANTLVMLPTIPILVKLVNKLIPGEDEAEEVNGTKYIDERLLETPVIAVGQTAKELIRMGNLTKKNLQLSMNAFTQNDSTLIKKINDNEKVINLLEDEITQYLVKLSKSDISEHQKDIVTSMFHAVNDIERIGDHAQNIGELASEKIGKKLNFSDEAIRELEGMMNYTMTALSQSIEGLENGDITKAEEVMKLEERIDSMERELRANHIQRLNDGVCSATVGAVFLDVISNFERIGDHATNIAQVTMSLN